MFKVGDAILLLCFMLHVGVGDAVARILVFDMFAVRLWSCVTQVHVSTSLVLLIGSVPFGNFCVCGWCHRG